MSLEVLTSLLLLLVCRCHGQDLNNRDTSAYWRKILSSDNEANLQTIYSATACLGLALLQEEDMEGGMKVLEGLEKRTPGAMIQNNDFVTLEALGGVYGMLARRFSLALSQTLSAPTSTLTPSPLISPPSSSATTTTSSSSSSSSSLTRTLISQEQAALKRAVYYFRAANNARQTWSTRGNCGNEDHSGCNEYAQLILFSQPQALALRGWGDALNWLGRKEEAKIVFQIGVDTRIWRSPLCRPVPRSSEMKTSFYFLEPEAIPHISRVVIKSLPAISAEFEAHLKREGNGWREASAGLHYAGRWKQLLFLVNGEFVGEGNASCSYWPALCNVIQQLGAVRYLRNGQVKLSRVSPGTIIKPHAGPSDQRLRLHCTLSSPGVSRIRVGDQWKEQVRGQCFAFNEACEHEVIVAGREKKQEVQHENGKDEGLVEDRVVLIMDFANPFLASVDAYKKTLIIRADSLHNPKAEYTSFWNQNSKEL